MESSKIPVDKLLAESFKELAGFLTLKKKKYSRKSAEMRYFFVKFYAFKCCTALYYVL